MLAVKSQLRILFDAAVKAVQPATIIRAALRVDGTTLTVSGVQKTYALEEGRNVFVVGFGKAVLGMAVEVSSVLSPFLNRGILSVPVGSVTKDTQLPNEVKVFEGAKNNLPDQSSLEATNQIIEFVKGCPADSLLIILISGGGSALLTAPHPPITLDEKRLFMKSLANSGATIQELNSVRKNLSLVKGGGLAEMSRHLNCLSLILSDVIGDPLDLIASGPTVANKDPLTLALDILDKYNLTKSCPHSIMQVLKARKPQLGEFTHIENVLIGSNRIALQAAKEIAQENCFILTTTLDGESREIAKSYALLISFVTGGLEGDTQILDSFGISRNILGDIRRRWEQGGSLCLMAGGESTVKVTGKGVGGRNQEMALALSVELERLWPVGSNNFDVCFLSAGTDGIDGPTSAAGAMTYFGQYKMAVKAGLDPVAFLDNNDSFTFFSRLNGGEDLVLTGHTGTNVMDVQILIIKRK